MLLEVTFGKLYSWAIHNVRNILLEASARFKELGEWRDCMSGSSQKTKLIGSGTYICGDSYMHRQPKLLEVLDKKREGPRVVVML